VQIHPGDGSVRELNYFCSYLINLENTYQKVMFEYHNEQLGDQAKIFCNVFVYESSLSSSALLSEIHLSHVSDNKQPELKPDQAMQPWPTAKEML
jgi:hypothetical protein